MWLIVTHFQSAVEDLLPLPTAKDSAVDQQFVTGLVGEIQVSYKMQYSYGLYCCPASYCHVLLWFADIRHWQPTVPPVLATPLICPSLQSVYRWGEPRRREGCCMTMWWRWVCTSEWVLYHKMHCSLFFMKYCRAENSCTIHCYFVYWTQKGSFLGIWTCFGCDG